jgi:SAM-dependent methyltransferase
MQVNTRKFLEQISDLLHENQSFGLSLGNYAGAESQLKQLQAKTILLKKHYKINLVYKYAQKDITKNIDYEQFTLLLPQLLNWQNFRTAHLKTAQITANLTQITETKAKLLQTVQAVSQELAVEHNRNKNLKITDTNKAYWQALNLADAHGNIYKNAQDKYRQINHFLEQLSPIFDNYKNENIHLADMGSGKGYLTFALYDYLTYVQGIKAHVLGIELRPELVQLCNSIARKSGFDGLRFEQGSIQEAHLQKLDLLIALHACDTATDQAIAQGIQAQAQAIVVAPCCHKQIRRQIEAGKAKNIQEFTNKYGIFLERQAEMITDGIRCLILNYFGYKTKVLEFVGLEHTPKNVLIIAQKTKNKPQYNREILAEIAKVKAFWGIEQHYLESLLKLTQ